MGRRRSMQFAGAPPFAACGGGIGVARAQAGAGTMLRRRLILTAVAIILSLSLGLIGVGLWRGHTVVSAMSNHLIRQVNEDVYRHLERMIEASGQALSRAVADLSLHDIALKDPLALLRELHSLLSSEPDIDWLFFGNEAGGVVSTGKLGESTRVLLMTDDFRAGVMRQYEASSEGDIGPLRKSSPEFDARQRLWYKRAKETGARYWTEPYLGASEAILGISLSAPVYDNAGAFVGVCGIDLILTRLSQFMQKLHLGGDGRAFISDISGQLVVSSGGVMPVAADPGGEERRLRASEVNDPIVRETGRYLAEHPEIAELSSKAGMQAFAFHASELGRVYAAVTHFRASGGISWMIISALPASNFLGPVRHAAYVSLIISFLFIGAILTLGYWGITRVFRPLYTVTDAAQALARGEWPDLPERQRADETGLLARAFHLMTVRLKETLDGLRRNEAYLAEAQRLSHTGSWAWDPINWQTRYWSEEMFRLFDFEPRQDIPSAEAVRKRIHPDDVDGMRDALQKAAREKIDFEYDQRLVLANGVVRHLRVIGHPVFNAAGEVIELVGTAVDVTERKRAEEEREKLRRAQADLAYMSRVTAMGALAASLAHEIRQPIAAATTNAYACVRWLQRGTPELNEACEAASRMIRDATRASEIIDRLHKLYRRDASQLELVDLNEIVREMMVLLHDETSRPGVTIRTRLAQDLPQVMADRVQLQQVCMNLMLNAVEAMKGRKGRLTVTSQRTEDEKVRVSVSDTGPGIPAEQADQIFAAFFTTKPHGIGMGLSISRSIIELHGGRLWADANAGPGATFHFTLPIKVAAQV